MNSVSISNEHSMWSVCPEIYDLCCKLSAELSNDSMEQDSGCRVCAAVETLFMPTGDDHLWSDLTVCCNYVVLLKWKTKFKQWFDPIRLQTLWTYLFIELIDNPLCPFQVQLFTLQWSIDISQLYAHLVHQQSVVLIGPINNRYSFITHLMR